MALTSSSNSALVTTVLQRPLVLAVFGQSLCTVITGYVRGSVVVRGSTGRAFSGSSAAWAPAFGATTANNRHSTQISFCDGNTLLLRSVGNYESWHPEGELLDALVF